MEKKDYLKLWTPVFLWCLVIFSLSAVSTLPAPEIIWWDFILKKTAHILEYGILFFLFYRAINKGKMEFSKKAALTSFLFCFLYSLSDEYHQSFVPGRHSKLMDVGFDFTGSFLSFLTIKNNLCFFKKEKNTFISASEKETRKIAGILKKKFKKNRLACLYGPLGSGKTTFVKGLGKALKVKDRVSSPTFLLMKEYKGKGFNLIHLDCYKIESVKDLKSFDLEELLKDKKNIVVIEWAEKVDKILPKNRVNIYFSYLNETKRKIIIKD
ncbi:tRNA (adenosine(37)-N6)-threonylcarbamoyltransferase complex ATPase subunit type 1 TsaE [Candidatus Beckwithbacteria bacterium CG10_big_fil_rev_8_21_14_0_10_34_10]|uniref:tRNA threonylcarbamoyladenosine biosynthesis protein TsaE n=1 Tax=Candidatus Beckwithbacteria bacterium CG10_big_fil_rev_8_21_14_0_10_34_10 TaxID=1974495 RepID=A0A2H0W857_9BACT|nr:MAG: tRNA (adenosine(37)-N6)-threonylcarbamoyltransferase complex ATPase subunit type 1 TsaE [Candidatus Beckwithbacteria bacterium CG10_big_fil_rev_8_21_14_0_10_34_10]